MTLCLAASCEDQDRREPCIVVSSDWKAEVGDVAGLKFKTSCIGCSMSRGRPRLLVTELTSIPKG